MTKANAKFRTALAAVLLSIVSTAQALAGPVQVEAVSAVSNGSGKITVNFATPTTAGELVVVEFVTSLSGAAVGSITDNKSSAYTSVWMKTGLASHFAAGLYYLANAPAGISSLTVTEGTGDTFGGAVAAHYTGMATASVLDVFSAPTSAGSASPWSSGQITTTQASDLLVGQDFSAFCNNIAASGSWLLDRTAGPAGNFDGSNGGAMAFAHQIVASIQTNIANTGTSGACTNYAGIVAFKAGSSGPPDTQAPTIPSGLSATAQSSSAINLSWSASTDNVGVTGYTIYRGGVQVGTSATTNYSDIGLSASTQYTYTVDAFDAAGNHSAQSTSASATTQAPSASPYPLGKSSTGRYLVDHNGNPFYLVGDTAHSLMGALTTSSAGTYFANRQQNHFNSVAIYAPCASYIKNCQANGGTVDGILPFTSGSGPSNFDLSTPNPLYWSRVDAVVSLAGQYGLTVLLDPMETGDFLTTLQSNGATKAYNYGAYIGNRYKNVPNIIYQSGEDFQSWQTSSDSNLVAQVMAGIASADPNHLQTAELSYNTSYSNQDATLQPYLTYDLAYTYAETYDMVLQGYNSTPIIPSFLGEANYENANNTGALPGPATPFNIREENYWTLTSGGTGGLYYGEYTVHHFSSGWQNYLNTPGVTQLGYLENLIAPLKWWLLVPDQTHQVVTSGYGTYNASNLNLSSANYATTAWVPDGSLSITYTPAATTLSVNMGKFSGAVAAQWFDPSAGTYQTVTGSPFANTGSMTFTTPGINSDGSKDWVLQLRATSGTTPPSPPTGLTATMH